MSLSSSACRLLLTSFLASIACAERPTEGGEQLALDVSGQLSVSQEFSVASRNDLSNDAINDRDTALSQVKAALENAASKEVELREAIYHAVESEAALEQRTLDTSTFPKVEPEALNSTKFGSLAELYAPRGRHGHGHGGPPPMFPDPPWAFQGCLQGKLSDELQINAVERSAYYMGNKTTLQDDPTGQKLPGDKMDPRWSDCRSMCFRLFLTQDPTGTCDSVRDEFTNVDGWIAPERDNEKGPFSNWDRKNGERRMEAVFRPAEQDYKGPNPFNGQTQATGPDTIYETLKRNVYYEDTEAVDYANGLRTIKTTRGNELKNFENTVEKIDMAITVFFACRDAREALKNDNVGFSQKVIASLDKVQAEVSTTTFKFPQLDEFGTPSLEAYKQEIRAKMHLSGATVRAQKVLDRTDDELDKAFFALKEALEDRADAAGVLHVMVRKGTDHNGLYRRMIRDGQDMAEEMQKKLQFAFAKLCQLAWQLSSSSDPADMAQGILQMDGLIARMRTVSERCSKCVIIPPDNYLELTQREQDVTIKALEQQYQQQVEIYQDELQKQVSKDACFAAVTQLAPLLKTVSDLSGMKEFQQFGKDMKKVSYQLEAWGELQKGMELYHRAFDAYKQFRDEESLVEVEQVEKKRKPAKGAPPPADEEEDDEEARAAALRAKQLEKLMPRDSTRAKVGKQLGKALGMALDQDKGLPDDFSEIIEEVEDWCKDAELLPGGCPQPVVAKGGIKGALGLGGAAWRSAIPLAFTYVLPVLAAIVCPSF